MSPAPSDPSGPGALLRTFAVRLVNISCLPGSTLFNALAELGEDVGPALPYLNAVLPRAHYSHSDPCLDFVRAGHIVTLRPRELRVTGVADEGEARRVIEELRALVNATWSARAGIEPAFASRRRASALEVLRCLPRTNCGECGLPTCLAFASQVSASGEPVERCPRLGAADRARLAELLAP